jgi:hypothetical protein
VVTTLWGDVEALVVHREDLGHETCRRVLALEQPVGDLSREEAVDELAAAGLLLGAPLQVERVDIGLRERVMGGVLGAHGVEQGPVLKPLAELLARVFLQRDEIDVLAVGRGQHVERHHVAHVEHVALGVGVERADGAGVQRSGLHRGGDGGLDRGPVLGTAASSFSIAALGGG